MGFFKTLSFLKVRPQAGCDQNVPSDFFDMAVKPFGQLSLLSGSDRTSNDQNSLHFYKRQQTCNDKNKHPPLRIDKRGTDWIRVAEKPENTLEEIRHRHLIHG
jgi:hypothetical protein